MEIDVVHSLTDGEIAVNNLESARQGAWSRFWRDPSRPGIAELIVEQEEMSLQFVGDLDALDRLETSVHHLNRAGVDSSRIALLNAQVASMRHCFADARKYLQQIAVHGEFAVAKERLSLSIDQACGTNLDAVLEERRRIAADSGRLEDLISLGALYADLREFDEADRIYNRALREYKNTSPFAVAWVCFQLGVLWEELVRDPQTARAAFWYQKAIANLPQYVKARVHLSELYLECGRTSDAEALLIPGLLSGDPEVTWRLAEVLVAMGRFAEAEDRLHAAQSGFDALLQKHLLAFADHGAEFYAGSGNNPNRAFELASINLANRPTLRAFEQAYQTAIAAAKPEDAAKVLAAAKNHWGTTNAFRLSPLGDVNADELGLEATT